MDSAHWVILLTSGDLLCNAKLYEKPPNFFVK